MCVCACVCTFWVSVIPKGRLFGRVYFWIFWKDGKGELFGFFLRKSLAGKAFQWENGTLRSEMSSVFLCMKHINHLGPQIVSQRWSPQHPPPQGRMGGPDPPASQSPGPPEVLFWGGGAFGPNFLPQPNTSRNVCCGKSRSQVFKGRCSNSATQLLFAGIPPVLCHDRRLP